MCCVQKFRWRRHGNRMLGIKGRRFKLIWSGNYDMVGGMSVMMKEKLCRWWK